MGVPAVRRRNRRSVGTNEAYNWPDTWIVEMTLATGLVTEVQVEFSYPMVTQPVATSQPFWNFRYWDTSANTTVVTPFVELVVLSQTRQAWLLSSAVSPPGPWQVDIPLAWSNFLPQNGGRVRGYDPQMGTADSVLKLPVWP